MGNSSVPAPGEEFYLQLWIVCNLAWAHVRQTSKVLKVSIAIASKNSVSPYRTKLNFLSVLLKSDDIRNSECRRIMGRISAAPVNSGFLEQVYCSQTNIERKAIPLHLQEPDTCKVKPVLEENLLKLVLLHLMCVPSFPERWMLLFCIAFCFASNLSSQV